MDNYNPFDAAEALRSEASDAMAQARVILRMAQRRRWGNRAARLLMVVYALEMGYQGSVGNGGFVVAFGFMAVLMVAVIMLNTKDIGALVRDGMELVVAHDAAQVALACLIYDRAVAAEAEEEE